MVSPKRFHVRPRSGLTLVEMLVSTALVLLLVLAVTQSFAVVSETISFNRASLEMTGQLRGISLRLQKDLDGLTAPVRPWLSSSAGLGYFEYVEGIGSDIAPQTYQTGPTPRGALPANSFIGDVDDVIMFTARSVDEPFVGTVTVPNIGTTGSDLAEIIWWTVLRDTNNNEVWDPGETFTIHRRVLLIKPELNDPNTGLLTPNVRTPHQLNQFYNENDVSVRPVVNPSTGMIRGITANTLSDLTLRENRFGHYPVNLATNPPSFKRAQILNQSWDLDPAEFPFPLSLDYRNPLCLLNLTQWGANRGPDNGWGEEGQDDDGNGRTDDRFEALWPGTDDLLEFQIGHDIMLVNALAFDVQAYDVLVPLRLHPGEDQRWGLALIDDDGNNTVDDASESGWSGSDDEALLPGDTGYALTNLVTSGVGGYVDLGYAVVRGIPNVASQYSAAAATGSRLQRASAPPQSHASNAYDTWPFDYERDGVNQDGDQVTDEGANGRDDDNVDGVDNAAERETAAPYGSDLRGLQVRIRVFDPDTRQVRQMTVRSDFTRE